MRMAQTCCCGCLSLRGASVTIGVLLTITSSLSAAGFLAVLVCLLLETSVTPPLPAELAGSLLGISALHLVFAALLVHGARRGRRRLLLAWLIFTAIVVILQTMAVVVAVALAGDAERRPGQTRRAGRRRRLDRPPRLLLHRRVVLLARAEHAGG